MQVCSFQTNDCVLTINLLECQISTSRWSKFVLLLLCYHLLLGGAVSEFTPTVYSIKSSAECGQYNPLHDQELKKKLIETVARLPHTHRSCAAILNGNPSAPSGYYNITTTNGSSIQVYCDMEGTNCGGEGGWTRVAYVNMTQPGATCPQGLEQQSLNGSSYCGRFSSGPGCVSAFVDTGFSYQQVCGRVVGYQNDDLDGFALSIDTMQLLMKLSLTDCRSCMVLLVKTFGHMPQDSVKVVLLMQSVHVTTDFYLNFHHTLVVTTTLSLEILEVLVAFSTIQIHCGMDSSVVVRRLPAAHTPTCHGSSRHSVRPPLRTLN